MNIGVVLDPLPLMCINASIHEPMDCVGPHFVMLKVNHNKMLLWPNECILKDTPFICVYVINKYDGH